MAKRNSRRGRPRKARSARRAKATREDVAPTATATEERPAKRRSDREGAEGGRMSARLAEQLALGERPQAPWHPLPLSELLIFVGLVGVVVGALRGESGLPIVAAGILAASVGTLDFSVREHFSGYRPHTTLLAAVPTALLHGALAIALLALGAPAPSWIVIPIAVDVPVFLFLFRRLRERFRDARRERLYAAGR